MTRPGQIITEIADHAANTETNMIDRRKRNHFPMGILVSLLGLGFAAYLVKFSDAGTGGMLLGTICLLMLILCIIGKPYGQGGDG